MRKLTWRGFFITTLTITIGLFLLSWVPFLLYIGLTYLLLIYLLRDSIVPRKPGLDVQTVIGLLTIVLSLLSVFIQMSFGLQPSPSAFHALLILGLQIIFFDIRGLELPSVILVGELTIAILSKTSLVEKLIREMSNVFVKITSVLVKTLIVMFKVPIEMKDNVVIVRKSMVIIGWGCSGLDAFVIYILATVLLIYIRKSSWKEALLLLLGALGIIPLNAIRIFTLLVIGYHSGISYLKLFHSHLGDLMFILYVYIYWWIVLKKAKKTEVRTTSQPSGGET